MISPTGTYAPEVWGSLVNCKHMTKTFEKLPFEIVVISFCKYLLGVRKQTTLAASRSDQGIFSFFIDIIIAMVKYYNSLQQQPQDSILWNTLSVTKKMLENGKVSWFRNLNNMCRPYTICI